MLARPHADTGHRRRQGLDVAEFPLVDEKPASGDAFKGSGLVGRPTEDLHPLAPPDSEDLIRLVPDVRQFPRIQHPPRRRHEHVDDHAVGRLDDEDREPARPKGHVDDRRDTGDRFPGPVAALENLDPRRPVTYQRKLMGQ